MTQAPSLGHHHSRETMSQMVQAVQKLQQDNIRIVGEQQRYIDAFTQMKQQRDMALQKNAAQEKQIASLTAQIKELTDENRYLANEVQMFNSQIQMATSEILAGSNQVLTSTYMVSGLFQGDAEENGISLPDLSIDIEQTEAMYRQVTSVIPFPSPTAAPTTATAEPEFDLAAIEASLAEVKNEYEFGRPVAEANSQLLSAVAER